jgi:AP-1-like transcription factor
MEAYSEVTPLWDLSQPTSFSNLPDDDFLALLQKQFPGPNGSNFNGNGYSDGVNPQNITPFALPSLSPPSDDSSPSPPNLNDSRGQSEKSGGDHDEDHTMKRKASDDDFEEGPSSKNQNTCMSHLYWVNTCSLISLTQPVLLTEKDLQGANLQAEDKYALL